jgi:hypothetical protein
VHIVTFVVWIVALVLFAVETVRARPAWNLTAAGLFAFTLMVGLQFLVEASDRITLHW